MTRAAFALSTLCFASAHAATLAIVNGGFETGTDGSATIAGWADSNPGSPGFWLQDGTGGGSFPLDPSTPQSGSLYLTANRLAGGAASQPQGSTLSQTIALDPVNLALVAAGTAQIQLGFYYHDIDNNDSASVSLSFLNSSLAVISSITTGTLANVGPGPSFGPGSPWTAVNLAGLIPLGTESVRIQLTTDPRLGGTSATNVHFDSVSAQVIPEPSTACLGLTAMALFFRRRRSH